MGKINVGSLIILALVGFSALVAPTWAETEDDDLLLLIPSIVASANQTPLDPTPTEPIGLTKVKELQGRWSFLRVGTGLAGEDIVFEEFYRFDPSTASASSDSARFIIEGESSLNAAFIGDWCDGGMLGAYSADVGSYGVTCDWGFPDVDLGSVYVFNAVSDSIAFQHFFYTPSDGMLSTGIATLGIATRISTQFEKTGVYPKIGSAEQSQQELVKKAKGGLRADYAKQMQMINNGSAKRDSDQIAEAQELLDKIPEQ